MARKNPETKIRFSIFNKEFREGIAEINKDTQRFRKELKLQEEQMKHTTDTTGKLEHNIKRLGREKENVRKKIELTQKQLKEAKEYYGENSEEARKLENQLLDLQISEQKIENAITNSNTALENQSDAFSGNITTAEKYRQKLAEIGQSTMDLGEKIQDAGKTVSDFGKSWSMKVTAPIVAGAGLAYKASDDVDKALNEIIQTTGKTGDEMKELENSFRSTFEQSTDSAETTAGVLAKLNVATDATGKELENLTLLTLDYAKVNKTEAVTSAKTLGRLMNALEVDINAMPSVMDKLTKSAQMSGIGVNELSEYIIDAGPAFEEMGFGLDKSIALFSQFEKAGANPKEVLSSLNIVMTRMAREGAKDAEEAFNMLMKEIKDAPDILTATDIAADAFGAKVGGKVADDIRAGHFEVDEWVDALKDADGTVQETAESTETFGEKMTNLRNKATLALEPIGNSLVKAFESALHAAEPLIQKIQDGAESFSNMSEEQQQTILKMVALVAAVGPASMVLGGLTTTIGGAVRVGGGLISLLGSVGSGAGLLGRFGLMGLTGGPVGIAIAGITGLGLAVYHLTKDKEKLHTINWDVVEQMQEEVEATDDLIGRYEELEIKNRLSTDEMLRYMDILTELKSADGAESIKVLTDEQAELLKKSGLTNDEMEEFLTLNDDVIEKSPDTTKAISDQGNAFAENLDALKKLNDEERENMKILAERELSNALENETQLLKDQKELTVEIKNLNEDISQNKEERAKKTAELNKAEKRLADLANEVLDAESWSNEEGRVKYLQLKDQQEEQQRLVWQLEAENVELDDSYNILVDKFKLAGEDLEQTDEQLAKTEVLKGDYEALVLSQVGINTERGNGLKAIDEEIKKAEQAKKKLEDQTDPIMKNSEGYKENVRQIDGQITKLKNAQTELKNVNDLAGKTVYDKKVKISTDPSISSINSMLSTPVNKKIQAQGHGFRAMAYAKGTNYHPGGPALVGEEGPELIREGSKWSLADIGVFNLKRGAQVFTADQTDKILRGMKRLPAYADGVGVSSELARSFDMSNNLADRVMTTNNIKNNLTISATIRNEADLDDLVRKIDNKLNENRERRNASWGV